MRAIYKMSRTASFVLWLDGESIEYRVSNTLGADIYTCAYSHKQARYQIITRLARYMHASPRYIDIEHDDIKLERYL